MEKLKLVIGDKNLSSWSMRAWLVAKLTDLPFQEILIPLDQPDTNQKLMQHSPSGKVPCLIHGDIKVWDSLAICEYLAELAPEKSLWPTSAKDRALARSYVAEMHSGFSGIRTQMSMDIRLRMEIRHLTSQTIEEVNRILFLWTTALQNSKGPFLFGPFGIVDAFYAPIVCRFVSYGVQIKSPIIKQYMQNVLNHPHVNSWVRSGLNENPAPVVF